MHQGLFSSLADRPMKRGSLSKGSTPAILLGLWEEKPLSFSIMFSSHGNGFSSAVSMTWQVCLWSGLQPCIDRTTEVVREGSQTYWWGPRHWPQSIKGQPLLLTLKKNWRR